jgi:hypothetical protein
MTIPNPLPHLHRRVQHGPRLVGQEFSGGIEGADVAPSSQPHGFW